MARTNLFNFGLRTLALTTVCVGLVSIACAADVQRDTPSVNASQVNGIALRDGGVLFGQVVDAQKRPMANQKVRILSQGRVVIMTETNALGQFGVRGLRGGVHTLESTGGSQTVQLWAPRTAPPAAGQAALILAGQKTIARGQDGVDPQTRRRRLLALGAGAAGLAWGLDYNPSGS